MKNKWLLIAILLSFIMILGGCNQTVDGEYSFLNASFESGTLKNWEEDGDAFTDAGVVLNDKDENGNRFNQTGEFLFYGKKAGLSKTGFMLSEKFQLKGNGKIGFLISGGANVDLCYVSLIDSRGNELATRANLNFDESSPNTLHRVILDGSSHIGKTVQIKIIDNDNNTDNYNYINVDDFIVNYQGVEDQVGKVHDAYQYVLENLNTVNPTYRHTYHAASPIGWSNDPNGLIWFNGEGHLFHQFNPYASSWGPMHWGHQTTKDFVKWELQPVALAPDQKYDQDFGCFSGTAIEKDGKLYLMYTGVANNQQTQNLAVSEDGINFEKLTRNPVISTIEVPIGVSTADFRDPKVFYHDGYYYCLIGTKANGYGMVVLYRSSNLTSWDYVGKVMNNNNPQAPNFLQLNGVYECPDFIELNNQEILIVSPQNLPRDKTKFENIHSVVYMVGGIDYQTGKFNYDEFQEFDGGFDFYAAQTMITPDGRTIMLAWMQMWDRTLVTQAHNWVGAYTLPRELTYKDGHIYQAPVREIENYRQNEVSYQNKTINGNLVLPQISGKTVELELEIEVGSASKVGVKLFKGTENETLVYYDALSQTVIFDRGNSGETISGAEINRQTRSADVSLNNGILKLRIFLDVSSVEVFINDGYITMTGNVYPGLNDTGIEFFTVGGSSILKQISKYDIIVK
ncbi:MAG: glycoside hydrolase family 32 protein [Bacilli bacterium]